jgi:galactokinase
MTGGGFAGCAVAAIDAEAAAAFTEAVIDGYRFAGHTARVWLSAPGGGASLIPPR